MKAVLCFDLKENNFSLNESIGYWFKRDFIGHNTEVYNQKSCEILFTSWATAATNTMEYIRSLPPNPVPWDSIFAAIRVKVFCDCQGGMSNKKFRGGNLKAEIGKKEESGEVFAELTLTWESYEGYLNGLCELEKALKRFFDILQAQNILASSMRRLQATLAETRKESKFHRLSYKLKDRRQLGVRS